MNVEPLADQARAFPLALARGGERLRIAAFDTGKEMGKRLCNLGLYEGSEVDVVLRRKDGSVVVSRDSIRLAIGAGTAWRITVMPGAPLPGE